MNIREYELTVYLGLTNQCMPNHLLVKEYSFKGDLIENKYYTCGFYKQLYEDNSPGSDYL